jgi:hypothetical protein
MGTLSSLIKTGPTREPLRILLHGVEGIGKTTFASKFPGAIFLAPEDGGGDLDVARLPIESWKQAKERVQLLTTEPHDYRTLVVDTIDFLERLCFQHVVESAKGAEGIEDVGGGWGKGYTAANEEQLRFVKLLDALREQRRMHIVVLAHTEIKTFANPEGASYDRYQLRMHKHQIKLWSEWVDTILFANYEIKVNTERGGQNTPENLKKGKARATAPDRILYTERRAAFDAKNRYSLPFEIPLDWGEFSKAIRWEERDAAIRANVHVPSLSVKDVYDAIGVALRDLDWTQDEVRALLGKHGGTDSKNLPESARPAVVAELRKSHSKHSEAK